MVCPRCITSVEQLLQQNGLVPKSVRLGEVELQAVPGKEAMKNFTEGLKRTGFELLDDQKMQLIEQVKTLLIGKVQSGDIEEHFSISRFLLQHIHKDYSAVSKLFSGVESITIEQFFILQKIEKVKEWLAYDQQSLQQIAISLGYSSPQHLSAQFKKSTGMTPGQFKQQGVTHRKPIDNLRP